MPILYYFGVCILLTCADACKRLILESDILGQHYFNALPVDQMPENWSGRVAYVTDDNQLYMYHTLAYPEEEGVGRWFAYFARAVFT